MNISYLSGIYLLVGVAFSYCAAVGAIELYGRYLLRKDAKLREKRRYYVENNN